MFPVKRLLISAYSAVHRRHLQTLVSTSWLAEQLSQPRLRIVHASWNNCQDFQKSHVVGAVCFDGEKCRDRQSPYKNMLPKPEEFAQHVGQELGISNDDHVVVYDSNEQVPNLMFAVRVWYMMRVFGHDNVSIMDGGLRKWLAEQRPVASGMSSKVTPAKFTPRFRPGMVLSYEQVIKKIVEGKSSNGLQLVDARSTNTFKGKEDPYGIPGHIPNSKNVPMPSLLDPETKVLRDRSQLESLFKNAGVDLSLPVATSCGTGMTACAVALAAHLVGKTDVPVYDGSWYEYSRRAPEKYRITE